MISDSVAKNKTNRVDYRVHLYIGIVKACIRKIIGRNKYSQKYCFGKRIRNVNEANKMIYDRIMDGSPFMVARFGDGELRATVCYLNKIFGLKKCYPEYIKTALGVNAGFFPISELSMDEFGELMLKSCSQIDVLAVWFNLLEDFVFHRFGEGEQECIYLKDLEPFWCDEPWTRALKGKKVLVIHPFEDTIREQYSKRTHLFDNESILPEFELITIKAIQSIGGKCENYLSWFDALEAMYQQAIQIDFDIAIIGCGAYGLPLAAKLKQYGKIAIHMGGVTQFLFGIKGGRWDSRPDYSAFYNEFWVRPMQSETPKSANQVEDACYW